MESSSTKSVLDKVVLFCFLEKAKNEKAKNDLTEKLIAYKLSKLSSKK